MILILSGDKVTVSRSEIKGMLRQGKFEELNDKYDGFMELALSLMMEDNALYGSNVRGVIENEKAEDLQNRTDITNILSTLGIRVMGMSIRCVMVSSLRLGHCPIWPMGLSLWSRELR